MAHSVAIFLVGCVAFPCVLSAKETDPLHLVGARATEGAAAGYLEDRICGTCHQQHYEDFQHVGMAQAFKPPAAATPLEDFGEEYFHAASQRYYQVRKDGSKLTFRRYQRDQNGRTINEIEIPIRWVLGSGNRARSYLYQTDWGELFLLPLSWYSESGQWRMSPGFEHSTHLGIHRQVKRECMFCHNALPEVPAGSDARWSAEIFPHNLPQGIGCQRCHGPGAEHVRLVLSGKAIDLVRDAIVNPANLVGLYRDSVCFQCHLLPAVSVVGARRIGRGDYSFRPGQLLSDYIVHVDIAEQGVAPGERFEINHHGYRFMQSACYRQSEGALSCISCHNPHVKPDSLAFRKKSATVCRACHNDPEQYHEPSSEFENGSCITCHMPTRRTSDVVEVTMTDHRIARGPFDADALIRAVEHETRPVTGLSLLEFGELPEGAQTELYRYLAALRANRFLEPAKNGLEQHLRTHRYMTPTPHIDLAQAQIKVGDFNGAEATASQLMSSYRELHVAYTLLGMAQLAQNRGEEAIANLTRSLEIQPNPETHFNLAAAHLRVGDSLRAEQQIDRALELRPYMAAAWKYKGMILRSEEKMAEARAALVRSLQLEPLDTYGYVELIGLLREVGDSAEADRYLELGRRVSSDPSLLDALD